ncbi:MAG: hypothetical protein LLG06_01755 [Desulfobacteraceae bacterium]|nr:hypothetical protein [Desulfobacteraceae bacterium]
MMKRIPKYYPDCDYGVKYIWQLVAESLVIEPWSDEEIAHATGEVKAQWDRLGVEMDEEE